MSEHEHIFSEDGDCIVGDCGMWIRPYVDALEEQNADLVRVVEKLLWQAVNNHFGNCTKYRGLHGGCTCGADEARALLLKIRGEE